MNFWNDIYSVARPEKPATPPATPVAPATPPTTPPVAPPPVGEPTSIDDNGGTTE